MTARLLFALCFGLCATAACSDDGTFFFDAGADGGTSHTGGVLIDLDNDGECDEGETVYTIFANNPFTEDDEVVIDLDTGAGPGEPGTCEDWDLLTE